MGFGLNNNVNTPIAATSPETSRVRNLLAFFANGVRTAAVAGAAEAPELELTGAAVANVLPQDWQNVESSGRVAPQKRQNIGDSGCSKSLKTAITSLALRRTASG